MTALFIILIVFLLFLYYLAFLLQIWRGLKTTSMPTMTDTPHVSVVIAARNEETNIVRCLEGLRNQNYPASKYEIIIVDDHSTDATVALAKAHAERSHDVPLKVISPQGNETWQGKPAAIARGVAETTGDIILCTDADCQVPPQWLRSMTGCIEPNVAFVAGSVLERPTETLFSRLASLEFLGVISAAAGLFGAGSPIVANGASIAYRKAAFLRVQGYESLDSSCDDETLMHRMIGQQIGRVVFNGDPDATVITSTPTNVSDFWSQRTRWAFKRGRYGDKRVLSRLLAIYGFFVAAFVAVPMVIVEPTLCFPIISVLLIKALIELTILRAGAAKFRAQFRLSHFLIAELFHVPYIVCAAGLGQLRSLRWKERTLNR